jgi:hypothetical protein
MKYILAKILEEHVQFILGKFELLSEEEQYEIVAEKIKGGRASQMSIADIAKKHSVPISKIKSELVLGIKVEKEHSDDQAIATEIALDHLAEFPDYYTRLIKMEKTAEIELNNK